MAKHPRYLAQYYNLSNSPHESPDSILLAYVPLPQTSHFVLYHKPHILFYSIKMSGLRDGYANKMLSRLS